ncbi:pyridoxamine 5'-phosphate oxidase family protein [Agromyces sp. Leaf222]|uniref:pyridoxamine 5'-phosphate oxidase family protein n=1 Tax=Agromyces sp. Leaf222 TaxID=1735688 RepID=UPI00070184BB|nr:pyridoxamine 5'-phosphate oxidase family protein [Agromyces sp. Leaf222]KQM82455.1 pyridoxamine 5'-phosphate oxidase [Agromyces sp. Leaf222]
MPGTEKERIIELARGIPFGWLTTVTGDGKLVSRPMSPREVTDDGVIWYFAERDSRDASEISANANVGVTLNSGSTFVSFAGLAELVDDPARKDELWDAAVEAWLPDGPQSPNAVLIKVTAESGEYWDTPGGRIATLISFVKAKVTGERYDGGENETVVL